MKRFIFVFISLLTVCSSTLMAAEITTPHVTSLQKDQSSLLPVSPKDIHLAAVVDSQRYDYPLSALQQAYYHGIDDIGSTIHCLQQGLWAGEVPINPVAIMMPQVMLLSDFRRSYWYIEC